MEAKLTQINGKMYDKRVLTAMVSKLQSTDTVTQKQSSQSLLASVQEEPPASGELNKFRDQMGRLLTRVSYIEDNVSKIDALNTKIALL